ncbi:MAG: sugar transferase [Bacteroidota bacterium]|nr:sugar transferase [Bacteroidota bacterium]
MPIQTNEGSVYPELTYSSYTNVSYRLQHIRRSVAGKQPNCCLILNPGVLANELVNDVKFYSRFSVQCWNPEDGSLVEVLRQADEQEYAAILVDPSGKNRLTDKELTLISRLKLKGGRIYNVNSFFEHLTGRIPLIALRNEWVINNDLFFVNTRAKFLLLKRAIDLCFCLFLAPFALLLSLLGMLLTKLSSKGPALFVQKRVGKNGKVFSIYKIRTMVHAPAGHTAFTVKNDNRVTGIGKILRRTKIDELPQLLNILKGEMSLIGPRPERDDIVAAMVKENPYYHLRHTVKPGVSGWAQIHNPTATPAQNLEKLEYDLYYVKNMSVFLDLKVLFKTIKIVFTLDSL